MKLKQCAFCPSRKDITEHHLTIEPKRRKKGIKKVPACKNCGHPAGWHSDGIHTHTGSCLVQLNPEEKDINKMEFCKCKEYDSAGEGK